MNRHGFIWRVKYENGYTEATYYGFVRAWTSCGALRVAEHHRRAGWTTTVRRAR